jgi:hypothetical protein
MLTLIALLLVQSDLSDKTLDRYRGLIAPTAEETRYLAIPWRNTLWEAVKDAQKQDKPIVLWAMNGHPLTCT